MSATRDAESLSSKKLPWYNNGMIGDALRETFDSFLRAISVGKPRWIPLAHIEGDESLFDEKITEATLRAVAANYEPARRKAPIVEAILPDSIKGPAHQVGELNPPAGWIEELQFDGYTLWGLARDVNGRLLRLIDEGAVRGSIYIWPSMPEVDGGPYLRHFAIIAAEAPGQANLLPIDDFFAGMDEKDSAARSALKELHYIARTISFGNDTEDEDMELDALLRDLTPKLTEAAQAAVAEAVKGLKQENDTKFADIQRSLDAATQEAKDAIQRAARAEEANRLASVESVVESLSKEGKIPPSEKASEAALLARATKEEFDARVAILRNRKAMTFSPVEVKPEVTRGIEAVRRSLTLPEVSGHPVNEQELALVAELMAEAGDDPVKFRKLAIERYGN